MDIGVCVVALVQAEESQQLGRSSQKSLGGWMVPACVAIVVVVMKVIMAA